MRACDTAFSTLTNALRYFLRRTRHISRLVMLTLLVSRPRIITNKKRKSSGIRSDQEVFHASFDDPRIGDDAGAGRGDRRRAEGGRPGPRFQAPGERRQDLPAVRFPRKAGRS